jgi:hypothetical protein
MIVGKYFSKKYEIWGFIYAYRNVSNAVICIWNMYSYNRIREIAVYTKLFKLFKLPCSIILSYETGANCEAFCLERTHYQVRYVFKVDMISRLFESSLIISLPVHDTLFIESWN